jgi:undecaprenyl-diphosphatase
MILFKAAWEVVELAFIVASLYFAVRLYALRRQPTWREPFDRRRVAILWLLALAAIAIKVTEDVVAGESGPIDERLMIFLHSHVSPALTSCFEAVTFSASGSVLTTMTIAATIVLVIAKRPTEAMLLAGSVMGAALVVYAIKMIVGRDRPALWDTQWYWGSSFPSGHTLVATAFAAASALMLGGMWPAARKPALVVAAVWIVLVALSRLVLGVHWPTDVLAAACIGAAIPLGLRFVFELREAQR